MESTGLSDEVAAKVRQQVEFYFGDSNLPNDKFLLRAVQQTEEGYVSLAVVSSFTKMKNHLSLPHDTTPETIPQEVVAAVAEALRSSSSLKVSEDGTSVARSKKLQKPDEARADLYARSIAVSPFPYNVTREEIQKFFEGHSKIFSIRLPRHLGSNVFSGSAVVEFSSPEEAQRVSQLSLNFKGADLKFQSKESFEKELPTRRSAKPEDNSYPKGLIVRFKLENLPGNAGEQPETKPETKPEAEPETKPEAEPEAKEPETKPDEEMKEGGAEEGEAAEKKEEPITREDIKAVFEEYGVVKFIDFSKGDTAGFVRFETPEGANKARTAAVVAEAGGLVVKDRVATLEAVQGEDESEYWKNVRQAISNKSKKETHGNRFKGGRFDKRNPKRTKKQNQQHNTATGKHVRLDDDEDNEDEPEAKLQRTA